MKVTTDACILGAWFAAKALRVKKILDIGGGTGLLMLMLAQQGYAVDGIEIDPSAFEQMRENLLASPWAAVLNAYQGDVRNYSFREPYDFIITNPPFYEGDLPSPSLKINLARHSHELPLEDLVSTIDKNLSPAGTFGILLPVHRVSYLEQLAAGRKFFLKERLLVRQTPSHAVFRTALHFSREPVLPTQEELTIKDEKGDYTAAFAELMKEYY
jgi:tRNA1Val (adenine37-N6)-methyltransferase